MYVSARASQTRTSSRVRRMQSELKVQCAPWIRTHKRARFATQLAWNSLEPFVTSTRKKFVSEDYYVWMEKLHNRLLRVRQGP